MKILISYSENPTYLQYHYYKYLSANLSSVVQGFAHNDLVHIYRNRSIIHRLIYRFFSPIVLNNINKLLLEKIDRFNPDVLVVFKGMEIYPGTLSQAKKKGVKLVNYNLDHPLEYHTQGSGNRYVRQSIDLYDMHISYSYKIIDALSRRRKSTVTAYLPFGHYVSPELYARYHKIESVNRVCFVGNPDKNRAEFLQAFCNSGLQVDVFGSDWRRYLSENELLRIYPAVYGEDFWRTLRRYTIQLNIFRPHNYESHNMRSFEIPAIGGIMLAPRSEEHSLFFKEGVECFFYDSVDEAISVSKRLLLTSNSDLERIRIGARERSVKDCYHYRFRAKILEGYLKELI